MKEYVVPTRLRPSPPCEPNRSFKAGDEVDVFRESEGCWVRGKVTADLGDSRYIVGFHGNNRPETEVDHFNLRLHRGWEDGVWVPSSLPQLLFVLQTYQYEKEAIVEVTSEDDEAYKGSWYCARVVSVLEAQNMRPVPPQALSSVACYETGDEVDAWFNKRWSIGRVSKVLGNDLENFIELVDKPCS
ncbi:unnamed protein product [Arabis nemorensis]|uniref:Agenet domain-containing protein n=1 Tax=Arabis nemorensis TaxID=586526 RepID=A0A565CGQ7_9BRAS|nr:unnamed protein product [Arabis nemorensis]